MIEQFTLAGVTYWRDQTGLMLPIMAGGQLTPEEQAVVAKAQSGQPLSDQEKALLQSAYQKESAGGTKKLNELKDVEGGVFTDRDTGLKGTLTFIWPDWYIVGSDGSKSHVKAGSVLQGADNVARMVNVKGEFVDTRDLPGSQAAQGVHSVPDPNTPGLIHLLDVNGNYIGTREQPGFGSEANRPRVAGAAAPDYVGAGQLLLSQHKQEVDQARAYYDALVQQGTLNADQAERAFRAAFDTARLNLDRDTELLRASIAQETAQREREIARSQRGLGLQEEAGRRAKTVATDILPFSVPGLKGLNLPLLGQMPVTNFNVNALFNQGQGPLSSVPDIGATPLPQPGIAPIPSLPPTGQPINFPPLPQLGQVPDITGLANQATAGFPGFRY